MNALSKRNIAIAILSAVAVVAMITLFVLQQKAKSAKADEIAAIGLDFEKRGLATQSDYIRIRSISAATRASGKMTDADLKWLLETMQTSREPLLHARILGVLTLLVKATESQKQAVARAIKPYVSSSYALEKTYAEKVMKALSK